MSQVNTKCGKRFIFGSNFGVASKKEEGFTLIEITVVIFGFSLVVVGLIALVSFLFTFSGKQEGLLVGTNQARKLGYNIINELRNAESSSTGSYSLAQAGEQELIFYSNIDSDIGVERLRYFTQDGKLYKGIVHPSGDPLSYDLGSEEITVVQNNLANGVVPVFYYYDGTYDGTTDNFLIQPVNVTQAKFIKVNLQITNIGGTTGTNFYTVTASGAIRNLKTNLGD